MLALTEKQMLIEALGQVVHDEVHAATRTLADRVAQVERALGDLPVPVDGKDGKDGTSVTFDDVMPSVREYIHDHVGSMREQAFQWVRDYVAGALDALPKAEKGEKGDKGDQGEPGKDGKDGRDGADGKSVSLDDVRDLLADLVAKAIGDIPVPRNCVGGFIDRRGHLFLSFSDGCSSDLGEVVGRDGKDCDLEMARSQVAAFLATIAMPKDGKDGKDGVGFDDLQLEHDGERIVTFKFIKGDNAKQYHIHFPVMLFRDVWRAGNTYEQSDVVQRDGAMWIALRDTTGEPGASSDWKLCVKRGKEGKQGERGKNGADGKDGRAGRDLTQMGLKGEKW